MKNIATISILLLSFVPTVLAGTTLQNISSSTVIYDQYAWRLHQMAKLVRDKKVFNEQLFLLKNTPHNQKGLTNGEVERIKALIESARYNEARAIINYRIHKYMGKGAMVFCSSEIISE